VIYAITSRDIAVKTARCRGKIRYLSKFTAASCGSLCDSTASCIKSSLIPVNFCSEWRRSS